MIEVPATEFARHFGRYREVAQHEPVAVRSHDRISGYFVSAREFDELQRLKAMAPHALAASELDDDMLRAIAGARVDDRHAHLDRLLDD